MDQEKEAWPGWEELPLTTVVQPASSAEVGELVRQAAAAGQAIYPLGGRTMQHIGLPAEKPGMGVDLRRLDQVIDYPARDMTITVQTGITLAKLQDILGRENQQLPIDVPVPEQATLGGTLAVNVSGPRRYGYGTLRDYVIGISVVNDAGQEVKAGGRVVKNVAGYDLCKLYVGSFGTLGIITQVTLKVRPCPAHRLIVSWPCPVDQLPTWADRLHQSRTRPVCLSALKDEHGWRIIVGFEGSQTTVDWQVQQLRQEMAGQAGPLTIEEPDSLLSKLTELPGNLSAAVTFKANLLPRATAAFCQRLTAQPEVAAVQAHLGNGIVVGHTVGDLTLAQVQSLVQTWYQAAAEARGNVVLLRCRRTWKKALPIWGQARGDAWLMRAVKEQLDPKRLFNPGRFVDGI